MAHNQKSITDQTEHINQTRVNQAVQLELWGKENLTGEPDLTELLLLNPPFMSVNQ